MTQLTRTGSCLCGAITFDVTLDEEAVHVCHCHLCQKWHGGPSLALKCDADWKIKGEDFLTWYDSSEWAQRGFCSKCGSHLFGRVRDGSYYGVHAGALDDQSSLKIGMHIFTDKKPPYYDFTDDSIRLTEQEFLQHIGAIEN